MAEQKQVIKDIAGSVFEFSDIYELRHYLHDEEARWKELMDKPAESPSIAPCDFLRNLFSTLSSLAKSVDNFCEAYPELTDENNARYQQELRNLTNSHLSNIRKYWLSSKSAEANAVVDVNRNHGAAVAEAFVSFVVRGTYAGLGSREAILGTLLAYEYTFEGSKISSRKKAEIKSISKIKSEIEKADIYLKDMLKEFTREVSDRQSDLESSYDDFIARCGSDYRDDTREKKETFEEFMGHIRSEWEKDDKTHKEDLRLSGPVQYWKDRAKSLSEQGKVYLFTLLGAIFVGMVVFFVMFTGWLEKEPRILDISSLQGALIFGSLAAIYAFGINAISKVLFSTIHLQRDAEEREQLTHVYLSLIHDGAINDDKSRLTVLQSIFSRSESGLLNKDSGPTMPGISDFIKKP